MKELRAELEKARSAHAPCAATLDRAAQVKMNIHICIYKYTHSGPCFLRASANSAVSSAVERLRHTQDSQGQILAVA